MVDSTVQAPGRFYRTICRSTYPPKMSIVNWRKQKPVLKKRLFKLSSVDHEKLFRVAESLKGDFLMTYDDALGVKQLASRHGFETELVAMKSTHHAEMSELIISRNLAWLRGSP